MNDFLSTWATPAGLTCIATLFGFAFRHFSIKLEQLSSLLAGQKDEAGKKFLELERSIAAQALYVEKTFVTKETLKVEMDKIDGRLGEIGSDVKEIRDWLLKDGPSHR